MTPVPVQPANRLTLAISDGGTSSLKVTWGDGFALRKPYTIFRTQMEAAVARCRQALQKLVGQFLGSPSPQYGAVLDELADIGSRMHFLLFDNCEDNQAIADEIKAWLEGLTGDTHITVTSDVSCDVPWTLLYTPPLPPAGSSGAIANYPGFWGLKYHIAVLSNMMEMLNLASARRRERFKVLFVLHEKELEKIKPYLGAEEARYLDQLIRTPVGSAYSWRAAREKWEPIVQQDSLLYVFCHSQGTSLQLAGDEIDVTNFSQVFRKQRPVPGRQIERTVTLCFLNGCSTAGGVRDNSFRTASTIPGFCGFVGTEAPVPVEFAARFGMAFVYYLVERGLTVQTIVDKLRRDHWPLGLLYSNYAHPNFSVEASGEPEVALFVTPANYSQCAFQGGVI